jgi:hypothetical protein
MKTMKKTWLKVFYKTWYTRVRKEEERQADLDQERRTQTSFEVVSHRVGVVGDMLPGDSRISRANGNPGVPMSADRVYILLRDKEKVASAKCTGANCYICSDGLQQLLTLRELVTELAVGEKRDLLLKRIAALRFFLLYEFQAGHLSLSSTISTHCLAFALSNPTRAELCLECDHQHAITCAQCN